MVPSTIRAAPRFRNGHGPFFPEVSATATVSQVAADLLHRQFRQPWAMTKPRALHQTGAEPALTTAEKS